MHLSVELFTKLISILTVVSVFYNSQYARKIHSVRYCLQQKSIPIGNNLKGPYFIFFNENISHLAMVQFQKISIPPTEGIFPMTPPLPAPSGFSKIGSQNRPPPPLRKFHFKTPIEDIKAQPTVSPGSEATTQFSWKRRRLLCIKVAYRNLAVHISLSPIGRSSQ